jgi:hypothetical protein
MNYIGLTEEEQEEFEREEEELDRYLNRKSRDIPGEYVKESETEKLTRYDYDDGTHESWIKENGDLVNDSDPFDVDAAD